MSIVDLQQYPATARASAAATPVTVTRSRLDAIDIVRGAVMVLMALDHTRGFFSNIAFDPTDLEKTNTVVFFTRWVTHFCAPVFVFLAGTGAFLYGSRGKTRGQVAWFLVSRGAWLVLLEFTLIHLAWSFRLDDPQFFAQVIWAIGCSMLLLAGLVFLPAPVVVIVGLVVLAGHEALQRVLVDLLGMAGNPMPMEGPVDALTPQAWLVALLRAGTIQFAPGVSAAVAYPVLPWFGVMALGYGLGPIWTLARSKRRLILVRLGVAGITLFITLRVLNRQGGLLSGYGDPRPWSPQGNGWFTFLSFINCWKYPPSLLYVLMTLSPAALALAWFDRPPGRLGRVLVVFGRVPLFYYVLHLFLIHGLAVCFALDRYGQADFLFNSPVSSTPVSAPADRGYQLALVYLLWLNIVAILYWPCRWFAGVKSHHREGWLSYL
jgi:uncharacterized membrane protein